MDANDTSFPLRSLNTFDNTDYQEERRVARRKQLNQMQQAFDSSTSGREFDDTVSLNTTQSSPAAFASSTSNSSSVRRARDLVTDLYSNDSTLNEERQNLAPCSDSELGMENIDISSRGSTNKVAVNGDGFMACCYTAAHAMGFCMEATVSCWARKTRFQKLILVICMVMVPVLVIIISVAATGNSNGGEDTVEIPTIQAKPMNEERHVAIRSRALEFSSELDLDTFGTSANLALRWLTDYDDAQLGVKQEGLVQRYVLAVLFFATSQVVRNGDTIVVEEWDSTNWMSKDGICIWEGVACPSIIIDGRLENRYDDNTAVVSLNLASSELKGSIPSELRALENLEVLDLGHNVLRGSIPTGLGRLRELSE